MLTYPVSDFLPNMDSLMHKKSKNCCFRMALPIAHRHNTAFIRVISFTEEMRSSVCM